MHIHVNGKNIEITDAIKAYVKEKIGKVANHYDQITGIDVVLSVIKNPAATGKHVAEVSCKMNTGVVHCEEAAESMYASIDLLADKNTDLWWMFGGCWNTFSIHRDKDCRAI